MASASGASRVARRSTPIAAFASSTAPIAAINATLPKLTSFVLPGGSAGAAQAHMARTIVRRAERDVVRLAEAEAITPALLRYLNRLSDHLFVLARLLNGNGADDVLWVPGANLAPR